MSGVICSLCGGDMVEDMQTGDMTCDCCGLIIRYDGTADYSLFYELLDSKIFRTFGKIERGKYHDKR